ncbi:probable LRR receptor-like serine/threonine-protein kinase At1g05700 [Typha latifolia]|uniref:probable LRR receptor-like serine/threonine-protein kinase At1g05700 n=1 Tax=Typha latifolia TaxID=4733 RepID=UPI003C2B485F
MIAGFITIDCGLPEKSSYVDNKTNLEYTSDEQFIDTGTNYNISNEYVKGASLKQFLNVRSFPTGTRNCYTLNSLVAGYKYLVRAIFFYGNYDGLNKPPLFDLYTGINFWKTVNASNGSSTEEVILVAQTDYLQVCLANKGLGTPFISGLELRPLREKLYPVVDPTRSVALYERLNMGPTNDVVIRYPDDPYDRFWIPWNNEPGLTEISTSSAIRSSPNDHYAAPSSVIQTAVTPKKSSKIEYHWIPDPQDKNPGFVAVLYFSELEILRGNAKREFDIYLNGIPRAVVPFSPDYLYPDALYSDKPAPRYPRYNLSIVATSKSTLPPIINALELFRVLDITGNATDSGDVSAMIAIKDAYRVKRSWNGDPCAPKAFAWDGLNCSYPISGPPRITTVNLSSSGLTGGITTSFANLTSLQYLDLSHNNLVGEIPGVLERLKSLVLLDLTGNQLDGPIPAGLLNKSQDGLLILRFGGNVNLCAYDNSCELPPKKKSSITPIIVIVPVVVVLLIVVIFVLYIVRKRQGFGRSVSVRPQNEYYSTEENNYGSNPLQLENRQFTYKELVVITRNFQLVIGKGGFGSVYNGFLENGTQVAVKMRSQSSSQGVNEFIAEAQHLTKVHHKNLVSLIGYCKDGHHLGLIYEYMSQGTLKDHLRGKARNGTLLTWRQRLQIALESAQGLEYLHKGCVPPLIHRDVKSSNILLNANIEAKLADFGLSKNFYNDADTFDVSTALTGTPGYIDPQYHATRRITEKSDIYSFGVVLLELITGQPPISSGPENLNIGQWVRQRLSKGIFESVIDGRMQGDYDLNSVWKVADLALKCTAKGAIQRPTMTEVVTQLKQYLELESSGLRNHRMYRGGSSSRAFEMLRLPIATYGMTGR